MTTPPPIPPRHNNNTAVAVVIGVVILVVVVVGCGVFILRHFVANTSVSTTSAGSEIHSPLGDIKVNGHGNEARVDINSPFGSVHVDPTPDLANLDLPLYPGATLVTSRADTPFAGNNAQDLDDFDALDQFHGDVDFGDSPGFQVRVAAGGRQVRVDGATFLTPAPLGTVLDWYRNAFRTFGAITERQHDGKTELEVRLSHGNLRAVSAEHGPAGTYFLLIRARDVNAAK